jgi:hypothetical protein
MVVLPGKTQNRCLAMRAAFVAASIVASVLTVACGPIVEHCSAAGAMCAAPPSYDLVLIEADSGKAGVSMGRGVAFLLDGSRNRLVTTPALTVKTLDDPYNQFPGKHAFSLPGYPFGVFDVVATGSNATPFTFHLVIGLEVPLTATPMTVVRRGDLIVQEYGQVSADPLPRLRSPTFDLVQDAVTVGTQGSLLSNRPALARQAYRAAQVGTQVVTTKPACYGTVHQVVVTDAPPTFVGFVYGGDPVVQDLYSVRVGSRFAVVVIGDAQRVYWTAQPADAVVRLLDEEVGPQPPGATMIPFRVMAEGKVTLRVRVKSRTIAVSIQSGVETCLPDDFPRYPLAETTSVWFQGPCRVDMATSDSPAQVLGFYSLQLNEGDWQAASAGGMAIAFTRRSVRTTGGTLEIGGAAIHIRIHELPTPSR